MSKLPDFYVQASGVAYVALADLGEAAGYKWFRTRESASQSNSLHFNDNGQVCGGGSGNTLVSYGEAMQILFDFITKKEQPITVTLDGTTHEVDFRSNGNIAVGCARIGYDKIEAIYEKATEVKNDN